jgi:magnesium-transporting ATPase (P-type)
MSSIDRVINYILAINIILLIISLGIPLAAAGGTFAKNNMDAEYLQLSDASANEWGLKAFGSFYLLNNSAIPLDLVIMIDIAKIFIVWFIENDVNIYGIQVKNMSLLEDLAQIDYLFCDKTGTLTQNELKF